jgi:hypothetical protein
VYKGAMALTALAGSSSEIFCIPTAFTGTALHSALLILGGL